MSVTTLQIPACDDHDDEPYQAKVWVPLRRATLAEIGRHVAMRRRSIARLTVLLAEAHGNRKQTVRIKRAIDRHTEDCAELDELVQAAAALGAQPDDTIGKVLVPRAADEPQAVRWLSARAARLDGAPELHAVPELYHQRRSPTPKTQRPQPLSD